MYTHIYINPNVNGRAAAICVIEVLAKTTATTRKYPCAYSFTQFEYGNFAIHEYLGQSLHTSENSQLSHFFNVLFQLIL